MKYGQYVKTKLGIGYLLGRVADEPVGEEEAVVVCIGRDDWRGDRPMRSPCIHLRFKVSEIEPVERPTPIRG